MKKILLALLLVCVICGPALAVGNACSTLCPATWIQGSTSDVITGFKVYLTTTQGGESLGQVQILGNVLTVNLASTFALVPNTQYYVKITAYNILGESLMSNESPFIFVPPGVVIPTAPQQLIVKGP